jgi:hypothetical protein
MLFTAQTSESVPKLQQTMLIKRAEAQIGGRRGKAVYESRDPASIAVRWWHKSIEIEPINYDERHEHDCCEQTRDKHWRILSHHGSLLHAFAAVILLSHEKCRLSDSAPP